MTPFSSSPINSTLSNKRNHLILESFFANLFSCQLQIKFSLKMIESRFFKYIFIKQFTQSKSQWIHWTFKPLQLIWLHHVLLFLAMLFRYFSIKFNDLDVCHFMEIHRNTQTVNGRRVKWLFHRYLHKWISLDHYHLREQWLFRKFKNNSILTRVYYTRKFNQS